MTTVTCDVCSVFTEANVGDSRARKAAEATAAYATRFVNIDLKLERLDGRLTLVIWQLALLIGGVASLVIGAFAS